MQLASTQQCSCRGGPLSRKRAAAGRQQCGSQTVRQWTVLQHSCSGTAEPQGKPTVETTHLQGGSSSGPDSCSWRCSIGQAASWLYEGGAGMHADACLDQDKVSWAAGHRMWAAASLRTRGGTSISSAGGEASDRCWLWQCLFGNDHVLYTLSLISLQSASKIL